ncbi:unnamed protein product [Nyctereutes procyonoides]|uniref:(raccoon dog) hypothetical protein n=1 Tax=Nyctereutes procyonoides TaxID=34880 RepID=A0A811Z592_NYCPR|nr:unnamed protein product [Nyctereutes procyonoides]
MSVACSAGKCWQPQDARWGQRPKAHSPGVGGRRLISAPSILTAEVGGQSWPCYSPRGGPGRARTDAQEAAVGASPPSGRILSFPWGTRRQALGAGAPILGSSWGCLGVRVRSRWLSSGPRAPAGTVGMQKALLGAAAARGPCRLGAALHSRTAGDSNHRHFFSLEKVIGSAWSVAPLGCPGSRPSSLTQWNYQASDLWTEPETGAPDACRAAGRTEIRVPHLRTQRLGGKMTCPRSHNQSQQTWDLNGGWSDLPDVSWSQSRVWLTKYSPTWPPCAPILCNSHLAPCQHGPFLRRTSNRPQVIWVGYGFTAVVVPGVPIRRLAIL